MFLNLQVVKLLRRKLSFLCLGSEQNGIDLKFNHLPPRLSDSFPKLRDFLTYGRIEISHGDGLAVENCKCSCCVCLGRRAGWSLGSLGWRRGIGGRLTVSRRLSRRLGVDGGGQRE